MWLQIFTAHKNSLVNKLKNYNLLNLKLKEAEKEPMYKPSTRGSDLNRLGVSHTARGNYWAQKPRMICKHFSHRTVCQSAFPVNYLTITGLTLVLLIHWAFSRSECLPCRHFSHLGLRESDRWELSACCYRLKDFMHLTTDVNVCWSRADIFTKETDSDPTVGGKKRYLIQYNFSLFFVFKLCTQIVPNMHSQIRCFRHQLHQHDHNNVLDQREFMILHSAFFSSSSKQNKGKINTLKTIWHFWEKIYNHSSTFPVDFTPFQTQK